MDFQESLKMVYRPTRLNDLDDAILVLDEILNGLPQDDSTNDLDSGLVEIISVLYLGVFYSDWGGMSFKSKLNLIRGYYAQCSMADLSDHEIKLLTDLLYVNTEAEMELLPPDSDDQITLIPERTESSTPSSRPTIPVKH